MRSLELKPSTLELISGLQLLLLLSQEFDWLCREEDLLHVEIKQGLWIKNEEDGGGEGEGGKDVTIEQKRNDTPIIRAHDKV